MAKNNEKPLSFRAPNKLRRALNIVSSFEDQSLSELLIKWLWKELYIHIENKPHVKEALLKEGLLDTDKLANQ